MLISVPIGLGAGQKGIVMPTTTDMQIAKRKLERDIYLIITDFENEFGVTVAFVGSTHSQEMCGKTKTVNVKTEVRV